MPSASPSAKGRAARSAAVMLLAALAIAFTTTARAETAPGIDELLAHVSARVAEFYERAQHVVCTEVATSQPIDRTRAPQGFPRIVQSELRVEAPAGGEATIIRDVLKVNGRAPREKDKKDRAGCTDPNPLSTEPLAFLLPAHRAEYRFRAAGVGKDRNRRVYLIDFVSTDRRSNPELIEDPAGHQDCFDWKGHVASRGRVWVDAATFDVVRVEQGLLGPVDVKVPYRLQRRHNLDLTVVLDRQETIIHYRTVPFTDPEEALLLPESIETLVITRGGLQSTRSTQVYSGYRRFVGDARIVD